jgi:hypothetical protein
MNNKIIPLTFLLVILALMLTGCINNDENSNNEINAGTWLDDYTPIHGVGTNSTKFWIEFPSISEHSGQNIDHLSWIQDSLQKHCVVFVVHKTGCVGCADQAERVIDIAGKYEEHIEFYDLDIPLGGDIEKMAYDSYLYDPNGPPGYIALTGLFTYIEQNGEIKIGWHSWEGNVVDSYMEDWIKDAIYYYHINSERN